MTPTPQLNLHCAAVKNVNRDNDEQALHKSCVDFTTKIIYKYVKTACLSFMIHRYVCNFNFLFFVREKRVVDIGTLTLCCLSCKAFCDTSLIGRCRIFLFSNNKYVAVK